MRAQLLHQVNELVEALAAVELRGNAIAEVERLAATAVGGDWARLHPALPAAIDAATDAEHAVIGLEGSHRYRAMELHVPRWLLRIPAQECKAFLRSVADACGHALERVELLYAERRARADLELLASASRGLAASLEPAKVVATLEEVLVPRLATRCEVVLGDEAKRSTPLPGTIAVDLEWAGRPVGQLRLQPRRDEFDESARDLLDELATRAAAALDNARLYEERATTSALLEASLLPHALLPVDNLELGGRYLAALAGHVVGGDFYDAMRTPDGRAVLIVGDVQGKGVEAATLTALARHTLRAGALAGDGPVAMLERLNAAIRYDQEERDAVAPDTIMRFVTAAVAELTPMATGFRARIAAAGHPRPIVVRPDGHVDHVEAKGPLLGLFEVADLVEATVHMGLSDLLVLYTDGVVEHRAAAELFDELELGRLVRNLLTTSRADDIAGVILDTVLALAPSESRDDIAILVARVTGPR